MFPVSAIRSHVISLISIHEQQSIEKRMNEHELYLVMLRDGVWNPIANAVQPFTVGNISSAAGSSSNSGCHLAIIWFICLNRAGFMEEFLMGRWTITFKAPLPQKLKLCF